MHSIKASAFLFTWLSTECWRPVWIFLCWDETEHWFVLTTDVSPGHQLSVRFVIDCARLTIDDCAFVFVCSFKLDGDTEGWLEIDPATGEIKTKENLDREKLETFKVTVTAFEKGEMRRCFWVFFFIGDTVWEMLARMLCSLKETSYKVPASKHFQKH